MKKILNIQSSARGEASYSVKLANAILDRLKERYPDAVVETIDLVKTAFPHLEEAHIASFFTPAEKRTLRERVAVRHSDENIRAVQDADILVIGAPMYNFSIPSALKAWIDHVVRAGVTFAYLDKGPEGLVKGKKVYVAVSSGGVFSEGAMKGMDFVEPYLRMILGFIGLTDITFIRVEGLAVPGVKEGAWEKAVASIHVD
ncbi:MAG TPA: NAD(P)H-dependent oxidoreductase [Puia sp.]|nr:NAD(P)H-dependent oxidoreductase [Puia sp.]